MSHKPRTPARRPTLREVAKIAGITPATVSYVLSGTSKVKISEPTRIKVLLAAEKIGYRPHLAARSLATGRTHTIGLCFGAAEAVPFADDYDREILHGVLQGAAEESYALQVIDRPGGKIPHHVDGWVAAQTPQDFDYHRLGGAPVVFFDPSVPIAGQICLWPDNVGGGRLLAEKLGPRARSVLVLAHESPETGPISYRDRLEAFETNWQKLVPRGRLERAIIAPEATADAWVAFVQSWKTAIRRREVEHIVCMSDMQAARVLAEMRQAGLEAPRDFRISGFDNTLHSRLSLPTLSTVDLHVVENAKAAVGKLLGIFGSPVKSAPISQPLWIERESTS